ncbi:MAG: single-stranded-DNA-specific exonuclease RecJ, partial [Phycisphaeraceae bacterium]
MDQRHPSDASSASVHGDASFASVHDAGSANEAGRLARDLGVPVIVARLLMRRGYGDAAAARAFLQPSMQDLHDPALLPGAERAAARMARAVVEGQPIVIYGDYDVDGVTASAILWHTLRAAGAKVACYVPHRVEEGYGLHVEAIAAIASYDACPQLREDGASPAGPPLIVSVDCGITGVAPAERARELGIDLIISDHHEFDPESLPAAHTLVHPRLPAAGDSQGDRASGTTAYPFGELCGAGVAFKLAWQFARAYTGETGRLPEAFRRTLMDVLPLAALGTVADVVPLVGENRAIVVHGLGRIKRTPIRGLAALIEAAGLAGETIDAYHVGFVLGPRLNACGRMGHAREAVELLTVADAQRSSELARELTAANEERQAVERAILSEAEAMLQEAGDLSPDRRAIVLGKIAGFLQHRLRLAENR